MCLINSRLTRDFSRELGEQIVSVFRNKYVEMGKKTYPILF